MPENWFEISLIQQYLPPDQVNVVVYHKNCNDGLTCALAAAMRKNSSYQFYPLSHPINLEEQKPLLNLIRDKNVIFIDIVALKPQQLCRLRGLAKRLLFVDHHPFSREDLKKQMFIDMPFKSSKDTDSKMNPKSILMHNAMSDKQRHIAPVCVFINPENAASYYAWLYFQGKKEIWFGVTLACLRDTWQRSEYKDEQDKFHFALKMYSRALKLDTFDAALPSRIKSFANYLEKEGSIKKMIASNKSNLKMLKEKIMHRCGNDSKSYYFQLENQTRRYRVDMLETNFEERDYSNDIAEHLYLREKVDFSATYYINKSGLYIIQMRTNKKNINLSKIAKYFGGGGHPCAAPIQLTKEQFKRYFQVIMPKKKLRADAKAFFPSWLKKMPSRPFNNNYMRNGTLVLRTAVQAHPVSKLSLANASNHCDIVNRKTISSQGLPPINDNYITRSGTVILRARKK